MPLTDTAIRNAKPKEKPYKLTDGEGMFLFIHPNGSKYWRWKYRFAGKEKLHALGVYPEVSLAEAREKRYEARKLISNNQDPVQVKKQAKLQTYLETENAFKIVAKEWHDNVKDSWTLKHGNNVWTRLEADILPDLKDRPIHEISAPELLAVIRKIEKRGAIDIAHRALQTSDQIFRYGIATGRAERNPASKLKGALKPLRKEHYAHLKVSELPDFLKKLEAYDGEAETKLALKLLLLTFVRTSELRGAEWSEIDLDKAEWRKGFLQSDC